jgi:hypothetical protein
MGEISLRIQIALVDIGSPEVLHGRPVVRGEQGLGELQEALPNRVFHSQIFRSP